MNILCVTQKPCVHRRDEAKVVTNASEDDDADAGSGSEGSEESDDDLPPLEPNRNKSHHRIGGGSRAASFPRGMPPSESESETESEDENGEGDATAEVSRGLANASIE